VAAAPPHEPFGNVVLAGARSGCESADAAGHRVPRRRALARAAALAPHWKKCLPEGILASAAMQPYLRRWAAADDAAAVAGVAAAVEAATAP
jgi:hypothetical protein